MSRSSSRSGAPATRRRSTRCSRRRSTRHQIARARLAELLLAQRRFEDAGVVIDELAAPGDPRAQALQRRAHER